ncbi:hypothetical protein TWF718_005015 [Orbilia javanica]|uniref:Uncharacterized protein n=1 Tax=Orbilia javanica TaxID=47235 RepID=A0AAN8NCW5_9PEZI
MSQNNTNQPSFSQDNTYINRSTTGPQNNVYRGNLPQERPEYNTSPLVSEPLGSTSQLHDPDSAPNEPTKTRSKFPYRPKSPEPTEEATQEPGSTRKKPSVDYNGMIIEDFKYHRHRATYGCGPDDPPLAKEVPIPTEPVELWYVPKWVMESKGPEWVYQWQNQGIYPDNPWGPKPMKRGEDGLFDHPTYNRLLELGDFDGAMRWTWVQLLFELGLDKGRDKTVVGVFADHGLEFFHKFIRTVEAMHERRKFAREHSEKYGKDHFDPLEDLNEEEREKELKYAATRVEARKRKPQKVLGVKAGPNVLMNDDVVRRDILLQRHFERQLEQHKMVKFSKQIEAWKIIDQQHAEYLVQEEKKLQHQAERTKKDTIIIAYRDYLGLVLPPEWLTYGDIDSTIDPIEVRQLGMYKAEILAKKRAVVEAGVDVENLLRQIDEEKIEHSFWWEVERIYRYYVAEHLGITMKEVSKLIREKTKFPEGVDKLDVQKWSSLFDPAGPEWAKEHPGLYNFNVYEIENLVTECKKHHYEVQKLEAKAVELLSIKGLSEASHNFISTASNNQIDVLRSTWAMKKSLIMRYGINQWREQFGGIADQVPDPEVDDSDEETELVIAQMEALRTKIENSRIPPVETAQEDNIDESWEMKGDELVAFAEADSSVNITPAPHTGLEEAFRQGLADTSMLGTTSRQRRKGRPGREPRPRPFGSKPRNQNSKQQSKQQIKQQSKQKGKQQSRPRDWEFQSLQQEQPIKQAPNANTVASPERMNNQAGPVDPRAARRARPTLVPTGRRGGRTSNLNLWPEFDGVHTTEQPPPDQMPRSPTSNYDIDIYEDEVEAKPQQNYRPTTNDFVGQAPQL